MNLKMWDLISNDLRGLTHHPNPLPVEGRGRRVGMFRHISNVLRQYLPLQFKGWMGELWFGEIFPR